MDKVVDTIDGRSFPRTEDVCCPLCGKHYKPRSIKVYFGMNAWVAECRACRIAFQTPRPSPEATLAYMNWRWSSSDEYVADREAQRERAEKQIGHVCQFVNEPIRLLDFGAGAGSFVRAAQDRGWTVTGVERSDTAIRRAQEYYGVQLVREVGAERFDVITMWDVIEHLRDPEGVLSDFRKCLVPGGLIFLETGNYENWLRIHQGDDWGLYLFDHQTYFSPSSLEGVLVKAGFGEFRLLNVDRTYPPKRPMTVLRRPRETIAAWVEWMKARRRWPTHGDVNVMVAVARNVGPEE